MKYSVLNKRGGFFSSIYRFGKRMAQENLVAAIILFNVLQVSAADPLAQWQQVHQFPPPQPQLHMTLRDVAFGNNVFVAVSFAGKPTEMITSQDGIHWTNRDVSGVTRVAYGNGKFVAAGSSFYTSDDGTNWVSRAQPAAGTTGIEFVNGRFFGFGSQTISVSDDGETWANSTQGINLSSIAFGNGLYVGVGAMGSNIAMITSTNGLDWTPPTISTNGALTKVVFAQGKFVATGSISRRPTVDENLGAIMSSSDGINWAIESVPQDPLAHLALNDLVYVNGQFVAVGESYRVYFDGGPSGSRVTKGAIYTSSDGHAWTEQNSSTMSYLYGITFAAGKYIAVGLEGFPSDRGDVVFSKDGIHWQSISNPLNLNSVAFGAEAYVAVGDAGTILRSDDGSSWTEVESPTSANLLKINYGGGRFVALGDGGTILSSSNGTDWVQRNIDPEFRLQASVYSSNTFYVLGSSSLGSGSISLHSADGIDWTIEDVSKSLGGLVKHYFDMAYGNGIFIVTGDLFPPTGPAENLYSTDGISWTGQRMGGTQLIFRSVEFGNGRFIALGTSPVSTSQTFTSVLTSTDGHSWFEQQYDSVVGGLSFGRDLFLAFGNGFVLSSKDGGTWNRTEMSQPPSISSAVYGQSKFVAVGENGAILVSAPFSGPWISSGSLHWPAQTQAGQNYAFEFTDTLPSTNWTSLAQIKGDGSEVMLSDTNTVSKQRYYRLRAE